LDLDADGNSYISGRCYESAEFLAGYTQDEKESSSNTGYVVSIVILILMCAFLTVLSIYFYDRELFTSAFQRLRGDDSELQLFG